MNILYIVQHFSGPGGTSGSRAFENARGLVARGHEVTLLCAKFEHGSSEDIEAARKAGIRVLQAPIPYSQKFSFAKRVLIFLRYMVWAIRQGRKQPRPDVVLASSTPLTVGEIGRRVAHYHKVPFVFEVRDLWPEIPMALGLLRNPFVIRVAKRMARECYRASSHIIALSPDMKRGILKWGVPEEKVSVVPNCSDRELAEGQPYRSVMRSRFGWGENRLVCIHPGAMGMVNGLDALLDCGKVLDGRGIQDICIALVGRGAQREHLEARIQSEKIRSVKIYDAVLKREMGGLLAAADIGIVSVAPRPGLEANSANKFFDFLAAGLPIVINYGGWQAQILAESGSGLSVPANDPESLADVLIRLRDDPEGRRQMGIAAQELAMTRYERRTLVGEIEAILHQTIGIKPDGIPDTIPRSD